MREIALTKKVEDTAFKMNANFIGIAHAACFENPEYTGNKPQEVMADVRSVIVLGLAYQGELLTPFPKCGPNIPIPLWQQLQP